MSSIITLEKCIDFWQEFCLIDLQRELDEFAGEIAKRQDEAESGRKRLIEMSKIFKRSASEETRKAVSPLLKSFQGEIDSLTKRSKSGESCFLTIYKKLSDAPDPTPMLSQSLSNKQKLSTLTDLEIEKRQLRETLEQYNIQFVKYRSQESEIENLKLQLSECQSTMAKEVDGKVADIKENIVKEFVLKEKLLTESNQEVTRKVSEQADTILKLQRSLEDTESEIFECKAKFEEEIQTKNTEIELHLSELEMVNQKLNQSGHLIESFQQSALEENRNDELSEIKMKKRLLEADVKIKDCEILRLVEETHNLQTDMTKIDSLCRSKIAQYEKEIDTINLKYEDALSEIESHTDYDEIKAELSILKLIEFGENYETNAEKSLELLLLDKNRAMQTDNSNLRLEVYNNQKKLVMFKVEMEELTKHRDSQTALIKQLELDLTQLQSHRVREDADGEPTPNISNIGESFKHSEDSVDMLAIVTSQRERFKAKNQILETDLQQLKSSYAVLQQDNATLRSDNMKLYERIKFLQTMSPGKHCMDDDITSKYSSQYETHIDPFSAFNRKERHRKYVNLNSAERVVLNLGKMVLSDKWARHAIFFYSIALHMLVFLVLYKFAVSEDCIQLSDCNERYQAHMRQYHP